MTDSHHHKHHHHHHHGHTSHSKGKHEPALQLICLASGGGPSEDSVTGFLVRSAATNWAKGSILAVDAGSHLAGITRLLTPHFPLVSEARGRNKNIANHNASAAPSLADTGSESGLSTSSASPSPEPEVGTMVEKGPFAGLRFPHESARANALWIVRECVSTYLITHPHLDHLSAFAINTAAFHNTTRPKKLAALPSTVNAIKMHIFNDIIWPNLTDEDGGVGFVTFQRLASGGNIAVGEGSGKGYIEVCDGICVKGMKISHGHCMRWADATHKRLSDVGLSEPIRPGGEAEAFGRKASVSQLSAHGTAEQGSEFKTKEVVVDSTAYFIRDDYSGREILFFGDVEPDVLSLNPRTAQVWQEAAPKVAHGNLRAVVIECSYDDSQADSILFGHLAPRHLFRELVALGEMVAARKAEDAIKRASKKRKHAHAHNKLTDGNMSYPPSDDEDGGRKRKAAKAGLLPSVSGVETPLSNYGDYSNYGDHDGLSPRSHPVSLPPVVEEATVTAAVAGPLTGLTVVVIHVKDTLQDGPVVGDRILRQLKQYEAQLAEVDGFGLGCEFVISEAGGSYWF